MSTTKSKELEPLTLDESRRLIAFEKTIALGKDAWKSAGEALIAIRDERLYKADHPDFWAYCEARWGWKRRNAETVIKSYTDWKALPPTTQNFAQSASQARELAKVEPEKRPEVLKAASKNGKLTAKAIKQAAAEVCPPEPEPDEKPQVITHEPPPRPNHAEEALGNLKAARVLKAFDAWLVMNFPADSERAWVLGLLVDHIEDLKAVPA